MIEQATASMEIENDSLGRAAPQGRLWSWALTPTGLSRGVSLLYAAVYLHYGVFGPFLPLWFSVRGVSDQRVGMLMSLPLFLRILFVAPVTSLADRLRRIREVLALCAVGAAGIMLALAQMRSYAALLAFFTVLSLVWDPLPVVTDAYAVASVRARRLDFGRMRVWGSASFVLANVAGGWAVQKLGVSAVPWMTSGLLLLPLLVLPFVPPDRLLGGPAEAASGDWRLLLKDRVLIMAIVATSLVAASHCELNAFSAIQWTHKGMSGGFVGLLWGISIAAEMVALVVGQKLLGERSPVWMIIVGASVAVIRWLLMALSPPALALVPLQLLQGASAMATIPGLMLLTAQRAPAHLTSSAQGLYAVLLGVITALAMLATGFLWSLLGAGSYLVMALLAGLGLVLSIGCLRRSG